MGLARTCPGPPEHVHEPLVGKTFDHKGKEVWLTQLAAEYHESLCEYMAGVFAAVHQEDFTPLAAPQMRTGQKIFDPAAVTTTKEQREKENFEAIGGLRNPRLSIQKLPAWKPVGRKLQKVLRSVAELFQSTLDSVEAAIREGK